VFLAGTSAFLVGGPVSSAGDCAIDWTGNAVVLYLPLLYLVFAIDVALL
jgi:hypothetical protein